VHIGSSNFHDFRNSGSCVTQEVAKTTDGELIVGMKNRERLNRDQIRVILMAGLRKEQVIGRRP
jgi:hypothetical protein